MDYIEGKTVKDILHGGNSSSKRSCEIILQVLDGLGMSPAKINSSRSNL